MLFNSCAFLFLYLPLVLAGHALLGRVYPRAVMAWLTAASLFFYAWWDVRYLPLLLASIALNWTAARGMDRLQGPPRRYLLVAAVTVNLLTLAWFKYADFALASLGLAPAGIVLPIGISFFTFTQIAYLVDVHRRGGAEPGLVRYALFVSYFPHLIAGPVLHHAETMPQFADPANRRLRARHLAAGITVFAIGLAKKVLIADNLAPLANPVFAEGAHPMLVEAWTGVLAYAFQLYFDFSGYSDMAIGLSRLLGITLPDNFNAPYKAADITEFWRRWHMSLSRFLRDYLYIPLGGNRHGTLRRHANLVATMVLGGLWHGAAWTFVAWGALHGGFLVVHQLWRNWSPWHLPPLAARVLTFACVALAWVFFRGGSFTVAADVLRGMMGGHGLALPHAFARWAPWTGASFTGLRWIEAGGPQLPALALAAALAWLAPTTRELLALRWRPTPRWALGCTVLFLASVFSLNRPADFLYFQF
ncbi:MAG: MBOAT family O-acyltransferase [Telluria sp.]